MIPQKVVPAVLKSKNIFCNNVYIENTIIYNKIAKNAKYKILKNIISIPIFNIFYYTVCLIY